MHGIRTPRRPLVGSALLVGLLGPVMPLLGTPWPVELGPLPPLSSFAAWHMPAWQKVLPCGRSNSPHSHSPRAPTHTCMDACVCVCVRVSARAPVPSACPSSEVHQQRLVRPGDPARLHSCMPLRSCLLSGRLHFLGMHRLPQDGECCECCHRMASGWRVLRMIHACRAHLTRPRRSQRSCSCTRRSWPATENGRGGSSAIPGPTTSYERSPALPLAPTRHSASLRDTRSRGCGTSIRKPFGSGSAVQVVPRRACGSCVRVVCTARKGL